MDDACTRRYSLAEPLAMRDRGGTRMAAGAPARLVDATFRREKRLVAPERRKIHTRLRIGADVLS